MKSVAALFLLGSFAAAVRAQEPSAKGLNFYSLDRERALGQRTAAGLERDLPVVPDPRLDAYLAQLGGALAKYANSPFPYTFVVYEDRGRNSYLGGSSLRLAMPVDAFRGPAGEPVAVAGGAIFVPMSLLAEAPDEAELAFQLAHAMAHVALRHATKWATRTEAMQVQTASDDGSGIPLGWLSFSRAFEREADYWAVQIAARAGYSPEATVQYLSDRLGQTTRAGRKGGGIQQVYSAHPPLPQRIAAIRAEFDKLPPAAYSAATGGFAEAQALAAARR